MAFPLPHPQQRAPRIKLGAPIPALVLRQNGQRAKGRLSSISVTGGLLQLRQALGLGDFVEVRFQMESGLVQGLAEMLIAKQKAGAPGGDGVRQAFRFIAMGDDDHRVLRNAADLAKDKDKDMDRKLPGTSWTRKTL